MKFQYSDLLVRDLHTNSWKTLRSGTGSLTLLLHLVCIKVSASLAAALVPPHVLAQVLLADHPAVHCPLVPCALVREGSLGGDKKGETARLAREQHCRCDQNPCTWGEGGPPSLPALESRWCSLHQNIGLLEVLPSSPGHEWGLQASCCTYFVSEANRPGWTKHPKTQPRCKAMNSTLQSMGWRWINHTRFITMNHNDSSSLARTPETDLMNLRWESSHNRNWATNKARTNILEVQCPSQVVKEDRKEVTE